MPETRKTHVHIESGYGFFCGGDPRNFFPDPDGSTEAEREKHRRDCEAWDRGENPNVNGNAPHFISPTCHIIPGGYGLGGYTVELECDDPRCPESDPDLGPEPRDAE